jgi:hypothetical protein
MAACALLLPAALPAWQGPRVNGALLPAQLPPLPATTAASRRLQPVIDEGIARTRTAKELYLFLEERASVLRGSPRPEQRAFAQQLVGYLASYKESWAAEWIGQRFFGPATSGARRVAVRFGTRGRASAASVPLPPLPRTGADEQDLQRLIDAGVTATHDNATPKALWEHLEQKVHDLRAAGERPLARKLSRYLTRYRQQWTAAWLSPGQRAEVRQRIEVGAGRVAQVVDGAAHSLPEVKVLVSPFFGVSGLLASKVGSRGAAKGSRQRLVNIVPDPSRVARDFMHELGHVAEDSDPGAFASMRGLLRQRAYGTRPQPLSELIPNTSYAADQKGLAAGFIDPYMARWYKQGWTEVLSTALERMETRKSAVDFFLADGWHFLVAASALR